MIKLPELSKLGDVSHNFEYGAEAITVDMSKYLKVNKNHTNSVIKYSVDGGPLTDTVVLEKNEVENLIPLGDNNTIPQTPVNENVVNVLPQYQEQPKEEVETQPVLNNEESSPVEQNNNQIQEQVVQPVQNNVQQQPKKTKTGIYKISMTANFGKMKHPISIDFQELSNTIYEKDYRRVKPIFEGDKYFYIYTPSFEEHLAEKLCIVTESNKENILNTRVKDFYDIYILCGGKYDKERLSYFFYHMLKDRNKIDINTVSTNHLNSKYIEDHSQLWEQMSRKYEFMDKTVDFRESVEFTKELLDQEISNIDKTKELKIRLR
jgi:hypothetical protein